MIDIVARGVFGGLYDKQNDVWLGRGWTQLYLVSRRSKKKTVSARCVRLNRQTEVL